MNLLLLPWYTIKCPHLIHFSSFFLWMTFHTRKIEMFCPNYGRQLTGCRIHRRVCQVLDIDQCYLVLTEFLRCTSCWVTHTSSSQTVLDHLDLLHCSEFRIILKQRCGCIHTYLTWSIVCEILLWYLADVSMFLHYRFACDIRVTWLMREQTLHWDQAQGEVPWLAERYCSVG